MARNHRYVIARLAAPDIPAAVSLFCGGYQALQGQVPALPRQYANPEVIAPLLEEFRAASTAWGAYSRQGRLVGYLGGWRTPGGLARSPGAYCPEWGHAVAADVSCRFSVYRDLYAEAAATWVREGRFTHSVTCLGHDTAAREAWFWLGFGLIVVDAVRDLAPVEGVEAEHSAQIRPAQPADAPALAGIYRQHQAMYAESPIFAPKELLRHPAELSSMLAAAGKHMWLAADTGGGILGFIEGTAGSTDACTIVRDPRTIACTGLYVRPEARGRGIGGALLSEMTGWASREGFVRISLDFESANRQGSAFWLSHCLPVCLSMRRCLDNQIRTANGGVPSDE